MEFIIFGFMDNFILIIGMYFSYLNVEYYLEKYLNYTNKIIVGCVSAGLGNTFSDAVGFAVTGNFTWMALTVIGCLLGVAIIPVMNKLHGE
jgi:hypothetical protein